jgi:hypothetical protein
MGLNFEVFFCRVPLGQLKIKNVQKVDSILNSCSGKEGKEIFNVTTTSPGTINQINQEISSI